MHAHMPTLCPLLPSLAKVGHAQQLTIETLWRRHTRSTASSLQLWVLACSRACITFAEHVRLSMHGLAAAGIPDLLQMLVQLTQSRLAQRLMFINELQATVLEVRPIVLYHCPRHHPAATHLSRLMPWLLQSPHPVYSSPKIQHTYTTHPALLLGQQVKVIEGLGTTMDVVLVNGLLREGAQVVVCGLGAPIVTTIRSLLTPHPMKVRTRPVVLVCWRKHAWQQWSGSMHTVQ